MKEGFSDLWANFDTYSLQCKHASDNMFGLSMVHYIHSHKSDFIRIRYNSMWQSGVHEHSTIPTGTHVRKSW